MNRPSSSRPLLVFAPLLASLALGGAGCNASQTADGGTGKLSGASPDSSVDVLSSDTTNDTHQDTVGDGVQVQCPVSGMVPLYITPGCGALEPHPLCMLNYQCYSTACSCGGKVIVGCLGFPEPYAYQHWFDLPAVGSVCDPNHPPADAGTD